MGLGGKVDKNLVVKVKANEVLVIRETTGYLLDGSGASSRPQTVEYALPPEESVVSWPYVLSVLPALVVLGGLSKQQALDPLTALPSVHVHSALTLAPVQAVRVPPPTTIPNRPISILDVPPTPTPQSARLLTVGSGAKPLMAIVVNPAASDTSNDPSENKIYILTTRTFSSQIDQLISVGEYSEALALLQSLDNADYSVPNAIEIAKKLRMLVGLSLFLDKKKYDSAIDIFIEENVNPAKVIALFPQAISGKLFHEREEIEEIWGGRTREHRINQQAGIGNNHQQIPASSISSRKTLDRKPSLAMSTVNTATATAEGNNNNTNQDNDRLSSSPSHAISSWRFSPMKRRDTSTTTTKDDDSVSVKSLASKRSQVGIIGNNKSALKDSTGSTRLGTTDEESNGKEGR